MCVCVCVCLSALSGNILHRIKLNESMPTEISYAPRARVNNGDKYELAQRELWIFRISTQRWKISISRYRAHGQCGTISSPNSPLESILPPWRRILQVVIITRSRQLFNILSVLRIELNSRGINSRVHARDISRRWEKRKTDLAEVRSERDNDGLWKK